MNLRSADQAIVYYIELWHSVGFPQAIDVGERTLVRAPRCANASCRRPREGPRNTRERGLVCRCCGTEWQTDARVVARARRGGKSDQHERALATFATLGIVFERLTLRERRVMVVWADIVSASLAVVARTRRLDLDRISRIYRSGREAIEIELPWISGATRYEDQVIGCLRAAFPRAEWTRQLVREARASGLRKVERELVRSGLMERDAA